VARSVSAIPETFARWYKLPGAAARTGRRKPFTSAGAIRRPVADARLVPIPAAIRQLILGLRPLVESGWIARERGIVCDCKSGASGAGKEPKRELHFVEVDENLRAYGLFSHRHTPEVTDHLGIGGDDLIFTTHLLPVARGILSTLFTFGLRAAYGGGSRGALSSVLCGPPDGATLACREVAGAAARRVHDFCDIGFALDPRGAAPRVVAVLTIWGRRRGPGCAKHERDAGHRGGPRDSHENGR